MCGNWYFRHVFDEFVFSYDGVNLTGCLCIMKLYFNI